MSLKFLQPMLAHRKTPKHEDIRFPILAPVKLDGVRAMIVNGKVMSRKMKPIPNRYVQSILGTMKLHGLDGELGVGDPWDPNLMQKTMSAVMSRGGEPDFWYYVFDQWDIPALPFTKRFSSLQQRVSKLPVSFHAYIEIVDHPLVHTLEALLQLESRTLDQGYEGLILRDPRGNYKYGRSTLREGLLLKLKRWEDGEAVIIGFEELLRNKNEAKINEVGKTKRSSHKANMVPGGTLGSFLVRDIKTGREFSVGGGLTDAQRAEFWAGRKKLKGRIITYKHFAQSGVKVKPRHPIFKAIRDPRDMS